MSAPDIHPGIASRARRGAAMPAPLALVQGIAPPSPHEEPVLDVHEIQGNVLVGFNKDHQSFLFVRIDDGAAAKAWLSQLVPCIATTAEVLAELRLRRAMRSRRGVEPRGLVSTWVNIALSFGGIEKLTSPAEAKKFKSEAFTLGMAERAALLGDAADASGKPNGWRVGDEAHPADVLLLVAGDDAPLLADTVSRLKDGIANARGLTLVYEQEGAALPGELSGHEHFGFRDGISQPGIRGRVSPAEHDYLTPRLIDPADERAARFSRPGQPLIWPGQFVLGQHYPLQDESDPIAPKANSRPSPEWSKNGSFLVWRRLKQDVGAFWNFAREEAALLKDNPDFLGMTPERLASLLVGRWPSGAPIMRAPDADNADLAANAIAVNQFAFRAATVPAAIVANPRSEPDTFPPAPADESALRCPFAAHIRKVNPRDDLTELGGPNRTLLKRFLRRGIPFGPPFAAAANQERGLVFVCYQASIESQFEFVSTDWANSPVDPNAYQSLAPPEAGFDVIIGQRSGGHRERWFQLPNSDGSRFVRLQIPLDFVSTTGGGYFFAPSISALRDRLAR